MKKLNKFLSEQKKFSEKTFGKDYPLKSVLKHLGKEVKEVIANPDDMEEWADVFILLMDAMMRNNISFKKILKASNEKLKKNKKRQWKKGKDGVMHHKK